MDSQLHGRLRSARQFSLISRPTPAVPIACRWSVAYFTLMPLGPRLRTSTGGLVYLSRSPPPVPCVTCGLPLPAGQEECACGKDNRYETSFWEVSEAVETAWEELDGVTLVSGGGAVCREDDWPPWPEPPEGRAVSRHESQAGEELGLEHWNLSAPGWTAAGGWVARHGGTAAPTEPAPIRWGSAGSGDWQLMPCPQCAPLPCASSGHFKSDEERDWWVKMLGRMGS